MDLNKENMKKIRYLIAFAVILYLGVQNLDVVIKYAKSFLNLLYPFILGAGIAFVLNVPMSFLERHLFGKAKDRGQKAAVKLARPVSLILAILLVALVVLLVVMVVAPELGKTVVSVVKNIETSIPKLQKWLRETFEGNTQVQTWAESIDIQPEKIMDSVGNVLKNGVDNVLTSTLSMTRTFVNKVVNFGIGFIFSCYILLQKERLGGQVKKAGLAMFPQKAVDRMEYVLTLASRIFANFITGQCIEAVILGMMFFVTLTVARYPYAMLIGVVVAFTALIPVFGAFIGGTIGTLLIFMVSPVKALAFIVIFNVLQQIEGNLIYPHVVGNSVGLPAIWVLVAVTLGGSLFGVAGMLIFIPLVSVCYTLFREWVYGRLEKKEAEAKQS